MASYVGMQHAGTLEAAKRGCRQRPFACGPKRLDDNSKRASAQAWPTSADWMTRATLAPLRAGGLHNPIPEIGQRRWKETLVALPLSKQVMAATGEPKSTVLLRIQG